MSNASILRLLAGALLAGNPEVPQIVARLEQTLGRPWKWIPALARRYLTFLEKIRPRHRDVVQFLRNDRRLSIVLKDRAHPVSVSHWIAGTQSMQPAQVAQSWNVPVIESVGALADWLWLEYSDLDWFADLKGLGYKQPQSRLHHYHYRVLPKPSGHIRLVEAPKPRLKKMQREILSGILDRIPPHEAAHGFCKNRSIITFAEPHIQRQIVLRMDLSDFFVSIGGARVQTIFRLLGYPEPVADRLGAICTNAVPRAFWNNPELPLEAFERQDAAVLYGRPHLPQGAPTSPGLANLCAYRVDCRLSGLAKSANATYTRYADDLAFSGGAQFLKSVKAFAASVAVILQEEGFRVNHHKTRIMRAGVRQHLAGIVVNEKLNVSRVDFDTLKATLRNCIRHGPESQNRTSHPVFQAHLEGRIAFFELVNPVKAARLRKLFWQILW